MSVDNGQLNLLDYAIIRIYSINSELKISIINEYIQNGGRT